MALKNGIALWQATGEDNTDEIPSITAGML